MHWENKKFLWLAILGYFLYCHGLESSQQYLSGEPVAINSPRSWFAYIIPHQEEPASWRTGSFHLWTGRSAWTIFQNVSNNKNNNNNNNNSIARGWKGLLLGNLGQSEHKNEQQVEDRPLNKIGIYKSTLTIERL